MAEKRMFAKSIVMSDAFLDMPASARSLYYTLGMCADDDGFVGAPKSIMRQCGSSEDDLKLLIGKRFILAFDSGVIVIKHWRINNTLKSDRYRPTEYMDELAQLTIKSNKAYTEKRFSKGLPPAPATPEPYRSQTGTDMEPDWNQTGSNLEPQNSIGKGLVEGRLEEYRVDKDNTVQSNQEQDISRACAREDSSLTDEKKLYGKYVSLTLREYSALLNDLGLTEFRRCRERADVPENADTQDWVALIRRYHEGGADT